MYQHQIEAKLRALDQHIGALKKNAGKQSKVDRKELVKEIAELDRKSAAAHLEFEKLQNSSQTAWQDMKSGLEAAVKDLETAYDKAASRF